MKVGRVAFLRALITAPGQATLMFVFAVPVGVIAAVAGLHVHNGIIVTAGCAMVVIAAPVSVVALRALWRTRNDAPDSGPDRG